MRPSVLFVAPSAYLLSGLATWLEYLTPGLERCGWDAKLCLVSGRRHHLPEPYLADHPATNALIAHCDTDTPVGRRRAIEKVLQEAKPDIAISVNIPDLFVAMDNLRASGKGGKSRAILSVHGIERFLYSDMQHFGGILDGVVCTNQLSRALSTSLGAVSEDRVLYAAYGVPERKHPVAKSFDGRLNIVCCGRLETPQKCCMDLVSIVAGLRARGVPFRLDVVGDGPDRPQLQTMLANEIADGSVVMHGYVSADDLDTRIYPDAHALILTSSWETGPIVVWEAMAHGVCVVSSRYVGSGLEQALEDGSNALLFDIGDTDSAVQSLERLWHDAGLRECLIEGGKQLVEQRYSIQASVEAWDRALKQVLVSEPATAVRLTAPPVKGRLDKLCGLELAESLRELLGRQSPLANDPGGEWPHSHSGVVSDDAFWELARACDGIHAGNPVA
ncbi:glycosyltransferase family 4 protein [Thermomonas sp.]|uniref:glycosyltransferase family 4 protein n=1 Tax=Thermomonas sp. TaxID=1971895 RepID=UPI0024882B6D|nr:glycosyltransferase family 4 protein [Thermomonas sp.]MDI1253512.1 glycosyltransferase family 4 protein [Thermomonas sp.]